MTTTSTTTAWMARTASVVGFLTNALLLFAYHVRAEPETEEETTFWDRFSHGPAGLNAKDLVLVGALVTLGFELLDFLCQHSGTWLGSDQIPVRGKHLDVLTAKDILFIGCSKANTAPFTYFYFSYACSTPYIPWDWRELNIVNTLGALVILFLAFDFTYTLLHGALHIPGLYAHIHKHHHTQKAPSRAAIDAVNVHPIEYVLGEYNHLLALWFCTQFVVPVHAFTTVLFLVVGGSLAAINHTRYDIVWSLFGITIFDSKVHDVHHRIPQSNYGQYTMFWDKLFGTFREYNPKDRVNPDAQLDPKTGKSFEYAKRIKAQ